MPYSVKLHPVLNDILIVNSLRFETQVQPCYPIVIVGLQCGVAVLRGAQAYAPGITAVPNGTFIKMKFPVNS